MEFFSRATVTTEFAYPDSILPASALSSSFSPPSAHDQISVETQAVASPPNRTFRFLSIFKWEERKGWRFLLVEN